MRGRDESGDFVTFDPQPDDSDIAWWRNEMRRRLGGDPITPATVAQALVGLFPCATQHCKVSMQRAQNRIALEITGTFEDGSPWLSAQEIDFSENALWKGLVLLPDKRQGQGLSRLLMRNFYNVASGLRLSSLRLRAMDVGSYAWLRYGFRPDASDWAGILKSDIGAKLGELLGDRLIGRATADRVYRLLSLDDPAAANVIAAERELVASLHLDVHGNRASIPLGRALIAEANRGTGTSWRGSLDLADTERLAVFLDYTRPGA